MTSPKRTLDASRYDTDKAQHKHYLRNYEEYFSPLLGRDIRLLELEIYHGGSLLLWRDYFEAGLIVGLDLNHVTIDDPSQRIRFYQGEQQNTELLDRIARECAPEGFDIIIDDCSHVGELTRVSFWHLFNNHLKSGGIYVIEDWGTGYWDTWGDGVRYRPPPTRTFGSFNYRLTRGMTRLCSSNAAKKSPLFQGIASTIKRLLQRQGLTVTTLAWSVLLRS